MTARRRPGSRAVETTSTGLFSAQTSRGSASDRPPVDLHPAVAVDVAGGIGDDLAADADPAGGDQLLGAPPRGDAAVGQVLGEAHAANAARELLGALLARLEQALAQLGLDLRGRVEARRRPGARRGR